MMQLNFNTQLDEITFAVVDTETNGYSTTEGGEMLEIAVVCIRPGLKLDLLNTYSSLINTSVEIHPAAAAIHNITTDMLLSAPSLSKVMDDFSSFINGAALVAHNARFDCAYINKAYNMCGLKNNICHVFDTVKISRKLNKGLSSHSLDSLINYYGVSSPRTGGYRHRALYDADHTAMILLLMLGELQNMGYDTLSDLYNFVHG